MNSETGKTKKRKLLKSAGVAAAVLVVASVASYYWPTRKVEIPKAPDIRLGVLEGNKKVIRTSARKYLEKFFRGIPKSQTNPSRQGYVDFMAGHSKEVRANIEHFTREGVVGSYTDLYMKCLDAAIESAGREMTPEEVDALGWRLVNHMKERTVSVYVDYSHPAVKEGFTAYGKRRAESLRSVVDRNLKVVNLSEDVPFEELIRRTVTREEFLEDLQSEDYARAKLYEGFAQSLKNFRDPNPLLQSTILVFGPGISKNIGRRSGEFERRQVEWIYGAEK
ncbi:MAG: hypothetical protein WCP89_00815 [archaeon]